jgi:hypothetical protein
MNCGECRLKDTKWVSFGAAGSLITLTLLISSAQAQSQEKASSKSSSGVDVSRKASDVSKSAKNFRRVPQYFGQVGISDQQRETIYAIREKYAIRQAQLEEELAGIQDKILIECEGVLTPEQKNTLIRLKGEAKAKASSRSKTSSKAAATKG